MRRVGSLLALLIASACVSTEGKNAADLMPPRVDGISGGYDFYPDTAAPVDLARPADDDLLSPTFDLATTNSDDLAADDLAGSDDLAVFFGDGGPRDLIPQLCSDSTECDNGLYCDGVEQCLEGQCVGGTPPVISDGVDCTDDFCNEDLDRIEHVPNDGKCSPSVATSFCGTDAFANKIVAYEAFCTATGCDEAIAEVQTCTAPTGGTCVGSDATSDLEYRTNFAPVCVPNVGDPVCDQTYDTIACTRPPSQCSGLQHQVFSATCTSGGGCDSELNVGETQDCAALFPTRRECQGTNVIEYGPMCDALFGCSDDPGNFIESCNFDPYCDGPNLIGTSCSETSPGNAGCVTEVIGSCT